MRFVASITSVIAFAASSVSCAAIVPAADPVTVEGWRAEGFPIDDFIPWSLEVHSKQLLAMDGRFVVVAGYLVVSPTSIVLFPIEEAAKKGRTEGAIVVALDDSAAMRWVFQETSSEGYFAIGGVFTRSAGASMLGHLTRVRFAMKPEKRPTHTAEPASPSRGGSS